jgi:endonuclease YncB( thermonuclease family)
VTVLTASLAQPTPAPLPFFRARLEKTTDGDTLVALLDTWFGTRMLKTLRLSEVNAPETRGVEKSYGLRALKFTVDWLEQARAIATNDWPLSVETLAIDPTENKGDAIHGRWAAVVWRHDGRSLNADLRDFVAILRQEYGQPFRYDGKAEE